MNVTLRTKLTTDKSRRLSLYLDFYPPIIHPGTGQRTRREFLKLYLFDKAQNPFEREHNKGVKLLAEKIWSKRSLEISNGEYGFLQRKNPNTNFVDYFTELGEKRKDSDGNYGNWLSALNYLKAFTKGHLKISDLNEKFCEDFKEYLLTTPSIRSHKVKLSQNAALSYFNKFKAAMKQAYRDKLLTENLNDRIKPIKQEETQREFLTQEELQRMAKAECGHPLLKTAALFSALTGLRWSDISKLTWSEIQHSDSQGYYIRFTQKKTKGTETLPISEGAVELLGTPGEPEERVFKKLVYSAHFSILLGRWALKAGITKNITFHCFRHTYATLLISMGEDLYTVSKMLGHRDLKTTQIYAKVIDQKKRGAADKIKLT